jgi:hypothetical protein
MRLLYTSTSLAFSQHVRVTLDREDIEYYCSDADSSVAGIGGPMAGSQSRFYILHEQDWERAVELMREILPLPSKSVSAASPGKTHSRWLVTGVVVALVMLVGAALAQ